MTPETHFLENTSPLILQLKCRGGSKNNNSSQLHGFSHKLKKILIPIPKSSTFHSALKNKFEKNPALISIYVADPVWRLWHHFLGSTLQNKQNRIWSMLVWKPLEFRLVALHHRPLPNHLETRIYLKKTLGGGLLFNVRLAPRKGLQKTQVSLVQLVRTNDFFRLNRHLV